MNNKVFDLIIVGGGAAGLTAAVYASRAGLGFILLDVSSSMGSQLTQTQDVENYTGFSKINGIELITKFRGHAEALGAKLADESVERITKENGVFTVSCSKNEYQAKTVIYCAGAAHRPLGAKGESEFVGKGVSYCAVCDGFFYKNKTAVVVGGGDTAVTDALYLVNICEKVYVVHRRAEFRAQKTLVDRLNALENVELVLNSEVTEICGDKRVSRVNLKDGRKLMTNGVFIAVGITPNSAPVSELVSCDDSRYIIADESGKTSLEGFFAAGDVRRKPLRQIITACADGANCVYSASEYIRQTK